MSQSTSPSTIPDRIVLEGYPSTRPFAVISWGAAATRWLAWALNSHPDIFCVHQANQFWYSIGKAPLLDGPDYLKVLICQADSYRAAGDVHGVSRESVPALREAFGHAFRAAVLIRNPQDRLRSQFALFEQYHHHRSYDVSHVDRLVEDIGLPIAKDDYYRKLYVHGINMLNRIIDEVAVGPVFTSESVTSDPAALKAIVRAVAGYDLDVSAEWCQRIVASPPRNSHNREKTDSLALPWVRELITKVVRPEAWELYRKFGYEPPTFIR